MKSYRLVIVVMVCLLLPFVTFSAERNEPRIIALAPHLVELIYEVGAGQQLVGVSQYSNFPEEAKTLPVLGDYLSLNVEKIVSLKPDLILVWQTGHPVKDVEKLKKLGFKVAYSDPRSIHDVPNELRMLGELTGKTEKAEKAALALERALSEIALRYKESAPVQVFYELWDDPLSTIGSGSWPSSILALCGAKNVFSDIENNPYPQVNIEQVLAKKVELIIQPMSESQVDKPGFNWQAWPFLDAVKQQKILRPDADKLHRMTSRAVSEVNNLCTEIEQVRAHYKAL